jgi:hypothetical protein
MSLPVICIVTAAKKTDANLVWQAMDRGPETFTRKLCAIGEGVTPETPPTHYLMSDTSSTESDVAIWQGMANGDLPPISGIWGVNGVISAANAMTATNGANLQVYSASGDVIPVDHAAGILASRDLRFVPDPEI